MVESHILNASFLIFIGAIGILVQNDRIIIALTSGNVVLDNFLLRPFTVCENEIA